MIAGLLVLSALGQMEVTTEQQLNRARTCYGVLDFECADRALGLVRGHLDRLAPELREDALRLSAEVALSRGRTAEAEKILIDLLVLAPRFAPRAGAWPPAWRAALDRARQRAPDQTPPRIALQPLPTSLAPGTAFVVRAHIVDETGVEHAELHAMAGTVAMTSTGSATYSALVPTEWVTVPGVGLSIRAVDLNGRGTATSTVFVRVAELQANLPPPPPPSEPNEGIGWWVWVLAGTAVVAGALTVALVATSSDEPGSVTARIEWP